MTLGVLLVVIIILVLFIATVIVIKSLERIIGEQFYLLLKS